MTPNHSVTLNSAERYFIFLDNPEAERDGQFRLKKKKVLLHLESIRGFCSLREPGLRLSSLLEPTLFSTRTKQVSREHRSVS